MYKGHGGNAWYHLVLQLQIKCAIPLLLSSPYDDGGASFSASPLVLFSSSVVWSNLTMILNA
jgi:hypothetical protein